jgi:hypothetical protein
LSDLAIRYAGTAARIVPLLDEYAGMNIVMGQLVGVFGAADRYRAQLHAICGTGVPGELFADALALNRRTESPLHEAETLVAWARYARHIGDLDLALTLEAATITIATPRNLIRVLRQLPAPGASPTAPAQRHPTD